jgi:hypothetical protein
MCRNIKLLFNFAPPATEEEIRASALQYVRKVTGVQKPTARNTEAFERAVGEITAITRRLLIDELATTATPRDRQTESERAKLRGQARDERVRTRILAER